MSETRDTDTTVVLSVHCALMEVVGAQHFRIRFHSELVCSNIGISLSDFCPWS